MLFLLVVGGVNTLSADDEFSASTMCADAETEPPECECLDVDAIGFAALCVDDIDLKALAPGAKRGSPGSPGRGGNPGSGGSAGSEGSGSLGSGASSGRGANSGASGGGAMVAIPGNAGPASCGRLGG